MVPVESRSTRGFGKQDEASVGLEIVQSHRQERVNGRLPVDQSIDELAVLAPQVQIRSLILKPRVGCACSWCQQLLPTRSGVEQSVGLPTQLIQEVMRQDLPDYAESVLGEFLSVFDSLLSCHGTAACHHGQPDVPLLRLTPASPAGRIRRAKRSGFLVVHALVGHSAECAVGHSE